MTWFNAIVYAVVLCILTVSVANAAMGYSFDPLAISLSVVPLLSLLVAHKLASRRPQRIDAQEAPRRVSRKKS
jgi:uncharacterized membrane protein